MIAGLAGIAAGRRRQASPNAVYELWVSRVDAAGGTYEADSKDIALALVEQLQAASFYSKMVYLLPLLGANLAAARVPLIDTLNVGIAANTNFVDGDFSQATGLKGNGSSKLLDLLIKPSQLGVSRNGGMGYWENQVDRTGTASDCPMGCRDDSNIQAKLFYGAAFRGFYWGLAANGPQDGTGQGNGGTYGNRSASNLREYYVSGTLALSNTTSDAAAPTNERNFLLMAHSNTAPLFWKGRCAVAYLTDGTLSAGDVSDLHDLLLDYLLTPTGRPAS